MEFSRLFNKIPDNTIFTTFFLHMKNIKYSIYCLAALILTATACSKDDDAAPADTTDPVITVVSPEDGSTIQAGTITIKGTIEEKGELEMVVVTGMMGPFSQSETITKDQLPAKNGDIYAVSQDYNVPSGVTGQISVKITATDNAGNTGEKTVKYTIQ